MLKAYGFLDEEIGKENAFVKKSRSGFMAAHVVGSTETVIEKLSEIFEVSKTDGLMMIFPDYMTGIPKFGKEVLPVLRERFPGKVKLTAHG